MKSFEVIVLGGGINGLCTAFHLLRRGVKSLALLDQFALGHKQGSSHGKSRITRSSYSSAKYVELIQIAHHEEWPRLSRLAGQELLKPTPGCFFGPGIGPYKDSLENTPGAEALFKILSAPEARAVFPQFLFPDSESVVQDLSCAVVAAEETVKFLASWVAERASVVENCRVDRLEPSTRDIRLHSSQGEFSCERLAVTAGAWVGSLFPAAAGKFQVAHQHVAYFEIEGELGFPVWVYCPQKGDSYYGLPSFGRPGAKVARHRTGRAGDDPDRPLEPEIPSAVLQDLEEFMRVQFTGQPRLVGYEPCLYTNTLNEDYLLDHHPEDSRIVIGSACSGHGFKFAPLTGRIMADLLLDGDCDLELWQKHQGAFRYQAHSDWESPSP